MDSHLSAGRRRLAALSVVFAVVPGLAAPVSAQSPADMKALLDDLVAANPHPLSPGRGRRLSAMSACGIPPSPIVSCCPPRRRRGASLSRTFWNSTSMASRSTGATVRSTPNVSSIPRAYKARADVNAVIHSHSPAVIPFSVTQVQLRPVHNTASFLAPGCPCSRCAGPPG